MSFLTLFYLLLLILLLFKDRFQELKVDRVNILFLGRMGAGKSSLLNSIASSIEGKYIAKSPTNDSVETTTTKFLEYVRKIKIPAQILTYLIGFLSVLNQKIAL